VFDTEAERIRLPGGSHLMDVDSRGRYALYMSAMRYALVHDLRENCRIKYPQKPPVAHKNNPWYRVLADGTLITLDGRIGIGQYVFRGTHLQRVGLSTIFRSVDGKEARYLPGRPVEVFPSEDEQLIFTIRHSAAKGGFMPESAQGHAIDIIDATSMTHLHTINAKDEIGAGAVCRATKMLALATANRVCLYSLEDYLPKSAMEPFDSTIVWLELTPETLAIVTRHAAKSMRRLRVFHRKDELPLADWPELYACDGSLATRVSRPQHASLSPDGKWVALKHKTGAMIIDLNSGETQSLSAGTVNYLRFVDDGERLATSSKESPLLFWRRK
jgi:hypothetical protein